MRTAFEQANFAWINSNGMQVAGSTGNNFVPLSLKSQAYAGTSEIRYAYDGMLPFQGTRS